MLGTYDEFRKDKEIIGEKGVDAVNQFSLTVELPAAQSLNVHDDLKRELGARLYRSVAEVIEAAELHAVNDLQLDWSDGDISVIYDDDTFGFRVGIGKDLSIRVTRTGSSLRLFHNWYRMIMPYVQGLMSRIGLDLSEILRSDFDLRPLRVGYKFSLITFDFVSVRGGHTVSSHELIGPLLSKRPGEDGKLLSVAPGGGAAQTLKSGRMDIQISNFRQMTPEIILREIYSIQAPGNQEYRGIWFDFHCIAETIREGNQIERRTPPQPEFLLENYEVPYVDFFRDRALAGFLGDFFKNWQFSCATGSMP